MRINIAIDGPSASGKSTIAKILAQKLGYIHLDTGLMYRAVAYKALLNKLSLEDEESIIKMLANTTFSYDCGVFMLDGKEINAELRTKTIDEAVIPISRHKGIRQFLVHQQKEIASLKGFILDGRDIGTVVLPDAELKIFQIASVESRTQRRFLDYQKKGIEIDYETVHQDMMNRDYNDYNRTNSPLKKADDAIEIDTSDMSIDETVECILKVIKEKLKGTSDD